MGAGRKKYVWDMEQMKWVEKAPRQRPSGMIMPDLPDVLSPIDGKVIHGRAGLRRHNKEHGVTHFSDYTNEWKDKERQREKFFSGDFDHKERREQLAQAVETHERRRR